MEYALDEPGTYLSLDASSLLAACAANNSGSRVSNLWIFPTNDANTVFVQYDAPTAETGLTWAARARRIERRPDLANGQFRGAAPVVRGRPGSWGGEVGEGGCGKTAFNNHCRTCHSVKQGDHRLGPSLYGVYGSEAGSIPGYRNSAQGFRIGNHLGRADAGPIHRQSRPGHFEQQHEAIHRHRGRRGAQGNYRLPEIESCSAGQAVTGITSAELNGAILCIAQGRRDRSISNHRLNPGARLT